MSSTWYVSTTGLDTNTGKIDSPWSLTHAAGGAGGHIVPGDVVRVRGGIYSKPEGFNITVSGTATDKITFRQYPGETVILDGSFAEFGSIGNNAWEPFGALAPGHNVYRSVNKYPVKNAFYGGLIQIGSEWYSLAPHKSDAYLLSDTHAWDYPNPRYLGPGIAQNVTVGSPDYGKLLIRLDNSRTDVQLLRPVPQISDPDPRNHAIYVCSNLHFGLTILGSHLVVEGFAQIDHFGGCLCMNPGGSGQTDVTIRNCGGRPLYFGVRCASIDGLILDTCKFYAHMPSHKWWVAAGDIKGGEPPAGHVRKLGLDLGIATHVEVANCLFDEFYDGILAPATHDVEVHNTTFNHIWDDTWQMFGNLYHINFHHNYCFGAGPSVDHTGTGDANQDPGTVYIHHNVIDTTTRLVFWGRLCSPGAGERESIPLSSHGAPKKYTFPRKLYYNTIVTGRVTGGPEVGWALYNPIGTSQATHEVYNNIFDVIDGRFGGRDFYAYTGNEIYDGNVYWYYFAFPSPSLVRSPWQLLHVTGGSGQIVTIHDEFTTVAQLRASRAFTDSQAYYPPGWENSGLSVDPQLDSAYKPQAASCQTGAIDLTTRGWPGTATYEPWRGAINP